MNKIILVLIFGFFVLDLSAQIKFNDSFEKSTLENQMEIFRDSTNSIIINDVLKNKERLYFVLSTEASPSFGHDSSQRWIHFKITNYASITLPFYIRIYRAYLDKAEFYLCRNDSVLSKVDANWKIPYYKKQISSRSTSAKFLLASNTKYDVYVLVKKTIGTWSFPAELFSQKEYLKMEKLEILSYGILIGGTILICFLSFSLFVLSSETLYLYYLMYAIFSTFSILSFGGILNYFFGNGISIFTGFESQFFYLIGFIITNILFTHKFFQLDTKGPKLLYYLGRVIIFICICYEFILCIDSKIVFYLKIVYLLSFFGILLIITVYILLVRGEILAKIYFIAFIPLILLLLITSISDLGYLKQQLWFYLLQPFPILFENSILLMALAYRLYDFQRKKQQLEIEIDSKIIQAQETERQRIAQDLHDEVGNSLAALKNLISQNFKSSVLSDSVSQIAQEVRNISHNLASINFDKTTLSEAFQSLMSRHNEAGNIEFEYIEVGKYQKIDSDKELALYRIACELLNNIQKHSKAKKATFQLAYQPDVLTLLVEDDGIGIRSKGKNTDGIGLTNIHARVAYLDAKLTIDDDGRGTVIVIDIPYNKNNS